MRLEPEHVIILLLAYVRARACVCVWVNFEWCACRVRVYVCVYYVRTENALISYSGLLPFCTLSTACGRLKEPVCAANFSINIFVKSCAPPFRTSSIVVEKLTQLHRNLFLANLCGIRSGSARSHTHARSKRSS